MTDITELAQSLKRRAASANEFGESLYVKADDVLALVEALETEKRICATWRKTAEANSEKLEKAQAKADVYDMLRDDYSLREKGVGLADFVDWQANRIAELEESHAQAIQSRDHYKRMTEEGLKQLAESRTVTVKLTDINEYLAEVHDKTLNRAFRLLAEGVRAGDVAAMRAAGIKVEAE